MSGNCETGIRRIAKAPAIVMTIAMTMARRGRSTKTDEIMARRFRPPSVRRQGWRWRRGRRRYRLAGAPALQALVDHQLACLQTVDHRGNGRRRLAELDRPALRLVVGADHIDIIALLIR